MKLDFRLKETILKLHKKVIETGLEYIEVLNDFNYEYDENLDDILEQYGNDVFDEMMKNDKSLILRAKGAVDKLLFKNRIIEDNGYRINERISQYHKEHMKPLNEIRNYIPEYMYGETYTIGFYQFEGSKVHKAFKKFCNETFENYTEVSRIICGSHGIPEGFKVQSDNRFIQYAAHFQDKPEIKYNDVDTSNPDWVKLVEEIELN